MEKILNSKWSSVAYVDSNKWVIFIVATSKKYHSAALRLFYN
jgi:hypothetical protein